MYQFQDLRRLTLIATVVLCAYATFDIVAAVSQLIQGPGKEDDFRATEVLMLVDLLFLTSCIVVVGRWTYRASANAHALGAEMTISPGWAVGWHFVPFANLIKPFHAMREIWWASHESSGGYEENVPILSWWWGLWITSNIANNMAYRFEPIGPALSLIAGVLTVPLCIILITIMRQVTSSQAFARHERTFA